MKVVILDNFYKLKLEIRGLVTDILLKSKGEVKK